MIWYSEYPVDIVIFLWMVWWYCMKDKRMSFGLRRDFWADFSLSLSLSHSLSSQSLPFCSFFIYIYLYISLFSIHLTWNCLVQSNFPGPSHCFSSSFFAVSTAFWCYVSFRLFFDHYFDFSAFIFHHLFLCPCILPSFNTKSSTFFLILVLTFRKYTSNALKHKTELWHPSVHPNWLLTKCPLH